MEDNRTKTILLVEDEAIIAITETQILRKHGYEVVTANSGEKAIEAVDIHPDISLILMDIDLGPGIDGTETAERILATRDLPVAFLSSHTEPEVVEKTEGITSYGYIVKNSGETVLIASIKMAFRLYEAREELERYFTSSLDLLCIANTAGEFERLNPEWERVLGYPVAELEGRSFLEFVHPEDRDATLKAVTELDAGEDVTSFVNRLRRIDGSYRHIEWRSRPIGSEIYAAARDVTDRKQAEATLLEQEALYRNLMENSSDGIELLDEAGNILNVNQKKCEMLGYSREELLGMTIADIDPNYPADGFYRFWKEQPKGSSILFETIHRHKDGTLIPVEVNGIFFTVQEKRYLFGVARDIRDRKQAEYEIQTREENLRITLNSIGDAVITTDINGRVTRMNPVAERLSGWSADTASGQALEDVLRIVHADSGDTVENPVARVLATGRTIGLANHTVLISRDGTKYQIADSAAPIRDDNGQTTGVVLVFRDVTEEYRIAQALSDSEHDMARAQALGKLGSWRFDLKNRKVTGSDQARRIYGIGENELSMEFVQSLPLPEFRPILDEALRALIEDGMPYEIEFRIRRPSDNSVRCIHSVAE
ncbi:MAG: PAS domain S-box protein, partial [Spirochaetaceae bacterium]